MPEPEMTPPRTDEFFVPQTSPEITVPNDPQVPSNPNHEKPGRTHERRSIGMAMRCCIVFAVLVSLFGCDDTVKGIQKDSTEISKDVSEKTGPMTTSATLTPAIKSAILESENLKKDGNLIDVDTTKDAVTLKGHVLTEAFRQEASQIAMKVLKERKSSLPLLNELKVKA